MQVAYEKNLLIVNLLDFQVDNLFFSCYIVTRILQGR